MQRVLILVFVVATWLPVGGACAASPDVPPTAVPPLTQGELENGWIRLFDGVSLFGWKANSDLNWTVRDGVIRADKGKPGLLLTTFELADYEFRCDIRLEKGGNSGFFLRTPFLPANPAKDCYELNVCDSHPAFPTGSIVGRQKAQGTFRAEEEWKTMSVRAVGRRIQANLGGQPVIDFNDTSDAPLRVGHIGLQMNGGAVEFRNVFLRPLSTSNLFNGRNLDGWHIVPGSKTQFSVEDGVLHAAGGSGFLETNAAFEDFVLQFDAKTNGRNLNSGVFFRAMPGTAKEPSNGYELQIHNGFKNDNRADPIDAGTGAIYRRTKVRWVIPDDGVWFTTTLIANTAHFSIWVNGIQVTDWTDQRPNDPNPRRGRRIQGGHLLLQGHDKTTDLDFRRFRIAAIPREPDGTDRQ